MATRQQRVQSVGFTKKAARKLVKTVDRQVKSEKKSK